MYPRGIRAQPAQPAAWAPQPAQPVQSPPDQPQAAWPQQQYGWPQQYGAPRSGSSGLGGRIAIVALCVIAIVVSSAALVVSVTNRGSASSSMATCESRAWRAAVSDADMPSGWTVREVDPATDGSWTYLRGPNSQYLTVELMCTNGNSPAFFNELRAEATRDNLTTDPIGTIGDEAFMRESSEGGSGSYVDGYWRRGDVVGTITWYASSGDSTTDATTMRTTLTNMMGIADKKLAQTK